MLSWEELSLPRLPTLPTHPPSSPHHRALQRGAPLRFGFCESAYGGARCCRLEAVCAPVLPCASAPWLSPSLNLNLDTLRAQERGVLFSKEGVLGTCARESEQREMVLWSCVIIVLRVQEGVPLIADVFFQEGGFGAHFWAEPSCLAAH